MNNEAPGLFNRNQLGPIYSVYFFNYLCTMMAMGDSNPKNNQKKKAQQQNAKQASGQKKAAAAAALTPAKKK